MLMVLCPPAHSGAKIGRAARIANRASQLAAADDGPVIDRIAATAASISELRDIVAARPGARQKLKAMIAPNQTIRISGVIFFSHMFKLS
jgi:hypothetical protein